MRKSAAWTWLARRCRFTGSEVRIREVLVAVCWEECRDMPIERAAVKTNGSDSSVFYFQLIQGY